MAAMEKEQCLLRLFSLQATTPGRTTRSRPSWTSFAQRVARFSPNSCTARCNSLAIAPVSLFSRRGCIVPRCSDDQAHFPRPWQPPPLRPGSKRALHIAGQHAHIASRQQRADTRFERLRLSRLRSRSFRENDEHVAGLREELAADEETFPHPHLPRERHAHS